MWPSLQPGRYYPNVIVLEFAMRGAILEPAVHGPSWPERSQHATVSRHSSHDEPWLCFKPTRSIPTQRCQIRGKQTTERWHVSWVDLGTDPRTPHVASSRNARIRRMPRRPFWPASPIRGLVMYKRIALFVCAL